MSTYKDEKTRGDIPDFDEHREKILREFNKIYCLFHKTFFYHHFFI